MVIMEIISSFISSGLFNGSACSTNPDNRWPEQEKCRKVLLRAAADSREQRSNSDFVEQTIRERIGRSPEASDSAAL